MPAYDICYVTEEGSLVFKLAAMCEGDLQAKVLAHAMKPLAGKRFEVWRDNRVIYARPYMIDMAQAPGARMATAAGRPFESLPTQQPSA